MGKLTDIIGQLAETHKKFNTLVKSHKWEYMQDVYQTLNTSFTTWDKSLRKQIDSIQLYMHKTFKYTHKEFEDFNEVGRA